MEENSKEEIRALRVIFSFVLRHYLFFGSIPLVAGAAFQYFALQSLGPGYARFFSASQLLIDGLILLTIFIAIVIVFFLISGIIITFVVKEYRFIFFIVSILIIVSGILEGEFIGEFLNDPLNPYTLFPVFVIVLAIAGNIILFNKPSWIVITVMSVIYLIVGIVYALFVFNTAFDFLEKSFADIPETNKDNIECMLSRNGVSYEDIEIEYMNDKFVFLTLNRKNGNEILVVKTEALFDFEQCGIIN